MKAWKLIDTNWLGLILVKNERKNLWELSLVWNIENP